MKAPGLLYYRLTASDCLEAARLAHRAGVQVNAHTPGQVVPFVPVRWWPGGTVNGQALLDGAVQLWVTSAAPGRGPGQVREDAPEPGLEVEALEPEPPAAPEAPSSTPQDDTTADPRP